MVDDLRCCLNWYRESDAQSAHWFHKLGKVCNGSLVAKARCTSRNIQLIRLACLTDGLDVTIERENVVKRDRKIILYIVKHK